MNQDLFPRRMKISNSHNTTTIITIIITTIIGAGMGPSSWYLDIVTTITTITTIIITAFIAATIEPALRMIGKQDPRVLLFCGASLQAGFLLRRAMKMPVGAVEHDLR